jgi:hypothetical protein
MTVKASGPIPARRNKGLVIERAYVAVRRGLVLFLRERPNLDGINFWRPSDRGRFAAIQPGEPFLFKLHYPEHAIVEAYTYGPRHSGVHHVKGMGGAERRGLAE